MDGYHVVKTDVCLWGGLVHIYIILLTIFLSSVTSLLYRGETEAHCVGEICIRECKGRGPTDSKAGRLAQDSKNFTILKFFYYYRGGEAYVVVRGLCGTALLSPLLRFLGIKSRLLGFFSSGFYP